MPTKMNGKIPKRKSNIYVNQKNPIFERNLVSFYLLSLALSKFLIFLLFSISAVQTTDSAYRLILELSKQIDITEGNFKRQHLKWIYA